METAGYWGWLRYPGLPPVLVSIAFPFAFHISMFFRSLFTCHWIYSFNSYLFFTTDVQCICTHSIGPSLADGDFLGLGLALVSEVVVPEAEYGVRMKRISHFKILPWPGFEALTWQSNAANVTTIYCGTPMVR